MASGKFTSKAPTKKAQQNNEKLCNISMGKTKKKEHVRVYDRDGERDLIVPSRLPLDVPGIFADTEFKRLKNQSHIITQQERLAMLAEADKKKQELVRASEKRKEDMLKAQVDQKAKLGSKLSDVEREAKRKNLYLLERSHELMQEQDDRVKVANGIILATKCRAIRNAQIAEKELIAKQLAEEELRLDMMMEQQRQKALLDEEHRKEEQYKKQEKFIAELSQQIKMNETDRLIEAERVEEEARCLNKAFIALQKEEDQKIKERLERQKKIRDELNNANEQLDKFKEIQKEEERIADLRIKKFMREKEARESAREAELEQQRIAKEKEIARLRAQQEKAQDKQAMVDEMNAIRQQEEVEREWRKKEMEAAIKKKELQDSLKKAREKQIEDLRRAAAIELARDESDFNKIAKIRKEEFEKEQEKKKNIQEERVKHRKELLKQINERERERIRQQQERFEEGKLQGLQLKRTDVYVKEHLKKKIEKLRADQIPENYVQEIENSLHLDVL